MGTSLESIVPVHHDPFDYFQVASFVSIIYTIDLVRLREHNQADNRIIKFDGIKGVISGKTAFLTTRLLIFTYVS